MDSCCTRAPPGSFLFLAKDLLRRLEKDEGENASSLTCSNQISRVGDSMHYWRQNPFSQCSCTCLGATLPEEEGHELDVALSIAAWLHDPLGSPLSAVPCMARASFGALISCEWR
jgi:hypothetical protein